MTGKRGRKRKNVSGPNQRTLDDMGFGGASAQPRPVSPPADDRKEEPPASPFMFLDYSIPADNVVGGPSEAPEPSTDDTHPPRRSTRTPRPVVVPVQPVDSSSSDIESSCGQTGSDLSVGSVWEPGQGTRAPSPFVCGKYPYIFFV